MTGVTVEQQGGSKRRREQPEVPQASQGSSSSSSSSGSSTDTEMGSVDVFAILCDNSEVSKRDRDTVKLVAVAEGRGGPLRFAEGREDGPITLDLTTWDFNKARCRTKCRKLVENSKPLLADGSGGGDTERARGDL